jgi:hypothetical protein
MLYLLLAPLAEQFHALNLFRYITFRAGGAFFTSLLINLVFGTSVIAWLRSMQGDGQPIRTDGPQGHLVRKKGTPTMGGFLILLALTISTLLWGDLPILRLDRGVDDRQLWPDRFLDDYKADAALASRCRAASSSSWKS